MALLILVERGRRNMAAGAEPFRPSLAVINDLDSRASLQQSIAPPGTKASRFRPLGCDKERGQTTR
jgi:hypothetical protein